MDRVSQAVKELVEEIQRMPEAPDPAETDRHAFTLLLNGIAACRRAPGIPSHMGYRTLYRCGDEPASEELKPICSGSMVSMTGKALKRSVWSSLPRAGSMSSL